MISLAACSLRVGFSAIGSHTFFSKSWSDLTPRLIFITICSHYKRDNMYLRGLVSSTCDMFTLPRSSILCLGDLPLVIHHRLLFPSQHEKLIQRSVGLWTPFTCSSTLVRVSIHMDDEPLASRNDQPFRMGPYTTYRALGQSIVVSFSGPIIAICTRTH